MKRNEDLVIRVKALVDEVDKTHRYSMSRIYGLYNEVYDTVEVPQSCASCLIRKVKQLKTWLKIQEELAGKEGNVSKTERQRSRKTKK